jgi:hypothetical protein
MPGMRRLLWLALVLAVTIGVAVVFVPAYTILPFKPQTPRGVEVSYAMRRAAPVVTVCALGVVFACAAMLWRGRRRWLRRAVIVVFLGVMGLAAWFARQNHFEWMFNPLREAGYVSAAEARAFLVDREIVMGVEVNGVALAYPIRQLAYHHVVNDVVGGTPFAATY